jgi:hypothetical protein
VALIMFALKRVDFLEKAAGRFSDTKLMPPEKWYAAISELLNGYHDAGAIRSMDALLVRLCESDGIAVIMLRHILQWHHRGIREDGAIWRSAEEWEQFTGLTRSQVYNPQRRERLKNAGIKVWVERAMGENTLHFLIDAARLTANISKLLKLNYNIALIKLWQIVPVEVPKSKDPIPFPQTEVPESKTRVPNSQIPLTGSSTDSSTNKTTLVGGLQKDFSGGESFALLNCEKLGAAEKLKYAVLPESKIQECIASANKAKANGTLRKPRLAYLRTALANALKEHLELAPVSATPQNPPLNPLPLPALVEAEKVVAADFSPEWWIMARSQLEMQLRRDWPNLARLELGEVTAGEVSLIHAPGSPVFLFQRLQRNIERVISAARFQTTKVRFVEGSKP